MAASTIPDAPSVRTVGLTRRFDSVVALDDLSVAIPAGTVVGVLGANGAGKTTLLNMLTTLLEPSAGTATVAGHDIGDASLEVRRALGYVPEHGSLYEGLTADEYLELAGRVRGMTTDAIQERGGRLLAHFDVDTRRGTLLGTFSKGMRRKVLITAALLHDPTVLILDEPMDGLDVLSQHKLAELLREWVARGRTVIYTSHVLEQVERLCEWLLFIHEGRLLWSGAIATLRTDHPGAGLADVFLRMTAPGRETTATWAELLGQ